MPTSTPHVCEATRTHNEITQTHTHTHGQATSHTHTRVVGEHHAQGHTNHALHREHTVTHCSFKRYTKQQTLLCPKEMNLKFRELRVDENFFLSDDALATAKMVAQILPDEAQR